MLYTRVFVSLLVIGGLCIPFAYAHAEVFINEIAWMGTNSSANAEWIELYNSSPSSVVLDGWSLIATDGSPSISLSGTVSGSGYFVLERTSDETLPLITAGQIYSGSLSNTGEHLQLKDNLGTIIDDVDSSSGWQGGDNTSKQTMQRGAIAWGTGIPTPGTVNILSETTPAVEHGTVSTTETSASTAFNFFVTKENEDTAVEIVQVKPDPTYTARMVIPDFSTVGVPISLTAIVKENNKRNMVSGKFEWSTGDGAHNILLSNSPLTHTFYYPGTYTIVLDYYSNTMKSEVDSIHKKQIVIVPAALHINKLTNDGGVIISSDAEKEIDLDGWVLQSDGFSYTFPKYTIVPKKGELWISSRITGFKIPLYGKVTLLNPNQEFVTEYSVSNTIKPW